MGARFGHVLLTGALVATFAQGLVLAGDTVTVTREIDPFDSVHLINVGRIILKQDEVESLQVETDEDALENIKTVVRNGTLELEFDRKLFKRLRVPKPLNYYVTVNNIRGLKISGSGTIDAETIETDDLSIAVAGAGDVNFKSLVARSLNVDISGSGKFELAGQVTEQKVDISGSGKYRSRHLESQMVGIQVSGSGKATVNAQETLTVKISGSGTVEYLGNPQISTRISGSGNISALAKE